MLRTRSAARASQCSVVLAGASNDTRRIIQELLWSIAPYAGLMSLTAVARLSERPLSRYAAILLDASTPIEDQDRVFTNPDLKRRSRLVVNLHHCPAVRLWRLQNRLGPELLVVGTGDEDRLRSELAPLLLTDPVVDHLRPALQRVCSREQAYSGRAVSATHGGSHADIFCENARKITPFAQA